MPFRCANGRYSHNEEPSLDEILAEPIVHLLMARDGVNEVEIRRLAREFKYAELPRSSRGYLERLERVEDIKSIELDGQSSDLICWTVGQDSSNRSS
jgi:hypothetical protein